MSESKVLLKGATLINPAGESGQLDLAIQNGKVIAIGKDLTAGRDCICRDLRDKYIFPAFIDLHVHLRDPGQTYKEDIDSGIRAALKGGFAVIAAMPNTQPVIDSPELVTWLREQGVKRGMQILPVAALSKAQQGTCLTKLEDLAHAGAIAFTDDGKTLADSALMREALMRCRELSLPIFQHSEDPRLSANGQVDPGATGFWDPPLPQLPASAEEIIVARDIVLQHETGGHLHVTHLSTAYAAEMVAWAKQRGQRVSADVTPHHLLLNHQVLNESGSLAKMKPPLRSEADRKRLIAMLSDGSIDCVATDHAPHSAEEKSRPFSETPFGVIGMETAFPLLFDRLVRNGSLPLRRLVETFSSAPARLIGQSSRYGLIRDGLPANLVVFDPERPFQVDEHYFRSKSRNSPFIGWRGRGVIIETIIDGVVRFMEES